MGNERQAGIDEVRKLLREALERSRSYNATSLARAINRDKGYVNEFLSGKKESLSANAAVRIEDILRLPPGVLSFAVDPNEDLHSERSRRAPPNNSLKPPPQILNVHESSSENINEYIDTGYLVEAITGLIVAVKLADEEVAQEVAEIIVSRAMPRPWGTRDTNRKRNARIETERLIAKFFDRPQA